MITVVSTAQPTVTSVVPNERTTKPKKRIAPAKTENQRAKPEGGAKLKGFKNGKASMRKNGGVVTP